MLEALTPRHYQELQMVGLPLYQTRFDVVRPFLTSTFWMAERRLLRMTVTISRKSEAALYRADVYCVADRRTSIWFMSHSEQLVIK